MINRGRDRLARRLSRADLRETLAPAIDAPTREWLIQGDGADRARVDISQSRHCEPTGPARSGRPDDRLREAIQLFGA